MDNLMKLAREALRQQSAKEPQADEPASPLEAVTIEPAAANPRPVYFEQADGQIIGPAVPEFLAQADGHFWVAVQIDGAPRWIRSDRLRSKQAFDQQVTPIPFERIKEVR